MSKDYYIIPIFVPHEGCPHNCVFCNQDRITGVKDRVTARTVYNIVDEYLSTINRIGSTVEISFFGGTFTAIEEKKQQELLQVAMEYKDKGLIDKIRLSTRPDAINQYILNYIEEYKVDIIELGVQSLYDDVLVASGRGHTVKDVEVASKLIKESGFTLGHQIMPGLPKDNFNKDIMSVKKSIEMKPDICRIYPSLVIKDTPMETMYLRGEYIPYSLEEAVEVCKELYKLYTEANVQIIRIGLQPTEAIAKDVDVIAGPFHPAFRELVEGSLMSEKIRETLGSPSKALVEINEKDLSKLYANKKFYYNKLSREGYEIQVKVSGELERGNILISKII
ncbi:elongator complex protein 3 [Clostridium vincentii]|uniref:Oxygen-independent coproporphyrinogen-III oxidase 1 n=1 Tax=Clostridium vincentii TaxID=52704 RepID=A0A2T0BJU6_9CLOT|nr:radical SAM protein [Clostridium vincentii]PRR84165.1 Oxygen-independent coproporphyrinogen-III oxidase 1 [Clostridium vincentii]